MPQISVIVPVYNVEKYIDRCVRSILGQSFSDFELILVDDGSPDNCPAICDAWAERDARISVIHQKNGGLSAARNAGIDWVFANSESEWITFVDSDDWVHPDYLKVLLSVALQHNVKCAICEVLKVSEWQKHGSYLGEGFKYAAEVAYAEHYKVTIVACAKLFRKELFESVRFPLKKLHEDAFTIYRIIFEAKYVAICWDPLYCYFQNPNGIMNSRWLPSRMDEIEAHESQLEYLKQNKFMKCYRTEQQAFLHVLARHIVAITELEGYTQYKKRLRKKLKKILLKYRLYQKYPVSGNEWVYEAAFPREMQVYWIIKAVLRRVM